MWDKWITCSLDLNNNGNIQIIDFFTNRDDWDKQNPIDFFESSSEYPIGVVGLNLIYYFFLKLDEKGVSNSHISTKN